MGNIAPLCMRLIFYSSMKWCVQVSPTGAEMPGVRPRWIKGKVNLWFFWNLLLFSCCINVDTVYIYTTSNLWCILFEISPKIRSEYVHAGRIIPNSGIHNLRNVSDSNTSKIQIFGVIKTDKTVNIFLDNHITSTWNLSQKAFLRSKAAYRWVCH